MMMMMMMTVDRIEHYEVENSNKKQTE